MAWLTKRKNIKAIFSDITGVLIDGGEGGAKAIKGSPEALSRLKTSGITVRYITNESSCTLDDLVQKLRGVGYDVSAKEIMSPPPAMCQVLRERNLRPHLLVHPASAAEFSDIDQTNPNCVVIGDAQEVFSYENLNEAFRILLSLKEPKLFSLGYGKYYKEKDKLQLDVGAFAKTLEFAAGVETEVVGKPSKVFFNAACSSVGLKPEEVIMIGDDVVSDVGGSQAAGMTGIQVRTGKYVASRDEPHESVVPDGYVNDLSHFVDQFLQN